MSPDNPGFARQDSFGSTFTSDKTTGQLRANQDLYINAESATVAHTLTITGRATGTTWTRPLAAGAAQVIECAGISAVAIDATDSNVTWEVGRSGAFAGLAHPSKAVQTAITSITFLNGAKLVDDGAGGLIFEGSDYTGTNPNVFQSIHFRHNGLQFFADGNNLQFDPSNGLCTVYGTLVTSGRGLYAIVGPTMGFPADTGAFSVKQSASTGLTTVTFHPDSTKLLTLRVAGELFIRVPNGGTWTVVFSYVGADSVPVNRTLQLVRDNGAAGTTGTVAAHFTFSATVAHLAANGGSNAATVTVNVSGAGGSQSYDVQDTMEWGDAN